MPAKEDENEASNEASFRTHKHDVIRPWTGYTSRYCVDNTMAGGDPLSLWDPPERIYNPLDVDAAPGETRAPAHHTHHAAPLHRRIHRPPPPRRRLQAARRLCLLHTPHRPLLPLHKGRALQDPGLLHHQPRPPRRFPRPCPEPRACAALFRRRRQGHCQSRNEGVCGRAQGWGRQGRQQRGQTRDGLGDPCALNSELCGGDGDHLAASASTANRRREGKSTLESVFPLDAAPVLNRVRLSSGGCPRKNATRTVKRITLERLFTVPPVSSYVTHRHRRPRHSCFLADRASF